MGAQRGADTRRPPGAPQASAGSLTTAQAPAAPRPPSQVPSGSAAGAPTDLLQKSSCTACHASNQKLVGPSWNDIAKKHAGKSDYLAGKIKAGSVGVWGNIPMPAQALPVEDAKKIADWLAAGPAR